MKKELSKLLVVTSMMEALGSAHAFTNKKLPELPAVVADKPYKGYAPKLSGPGNSQRKRRKLARQNPHSKYSK